MVIACTGVAVAGALLLPCLGGWQSIGASGIGYVMPRCRSQRIARASQGGGVDVQREAKADDALRSSTHGDEGADVPPAPEGDSTLFFGGVAAEREKKPEESEAQRVANRINEALAMRRMPRPAPLAIAETGWYDELGIAPTATQEELTLAYLEQAEDIEARLGYLLEGPSGEAELDDDIEEEEDRGDEVGGNEISLAVQPEDESALAPAPTSGVDSSANSEAEQVALEFMRLSNLYQILAVPQLRRIYDEGGVEGLAERVPALHKGLLEPEKVLMMARGMKVPIEEKISLKLRQEPRRMTFQRYQAKNSIRQVLRRLTDVFRVWTFQTKEHLALRDGTIFAELPEVVVLGRTNAGKSSMLQHLLSAAPMRRKKYAQKSQRPGKTQGIHTYCVNRRFTLSDTPGYSDENIAHGSAIAVAEDWNTKWRPLLENYLNTTHWLRAAIYVHDIAKEVTKADWDTIGLLKKFNIPTLLVFTKDDKVDSDTHRVARADRIRRKLKWPYEWPHAYYTTQRGGYGQVFKNMFGTMLLGLLSTEAREDAWDVLLNELPDVFFDYRDKYVPRPRGHFGKLPKEKKVRTYKDEDEVYTDEDLEREELELEREEKRRRRAEQEAAGYKRTPRDDIEEEAGEVLSPKERRQRWEALLQES